MINCWHITTCDLLQKEEQLSYVKLQRSEQPTNAKRKRTAPAQESYTNSDMPYLEASDIEEEPAEDDPKEEESDEDEPDAEVEEPTPIPIAKRSPGHYPYEGRSPKRQHIVELTEEEPTNLQTESRDRKDRSRSPV